MLDITIEDVVKLNIDDGDILLITLPEPVPLHKVDEMRERIQEQFAELLDGKLLKIVILGHGMSVEFIPVSKLKTLTQGEK